MKTLRDDRGAGVVWVLVFLPVLVFAITYAVTQVQTVGAADPDLSGALQMAARAAAMQVTPDSQAAGDPRIDPARAHQAFRRVMAENLGLDEAGLAPLPGSALKEAPAYVLVVYNGDGSYAGGGAAAATRYTFAGGTVAGSAFAAAGFPASFRVAEMEVTPGAPGGIQVILDRPGVIAVAGAATRPVAGRAEVRPVRWAAAKIVGF